MYGGPHHSSPKPARVALSTQRGGVDKSGWVAGKVSGHCFDTGKVTPLVDSLSGAVGRRAWVNSGDRALSRHCPPSPGTPMSTGHSSGGELNQWDKLTNHSVSSPTHLLEKNEISLLLQVVEFIKTLNSILSCTTTPTRLIGGLSC